MKTKIAGQTDVYPRLVYFTNNKTVVLLTAPNTGAILHVGIGTHPIGYFSPGWAEAHMVDFTGTLELSN